jgi:hypothetical protein
MYCLWEQLKQNWVFTKEILKGNKQHLKHVLLKAGNKIYY